MSIKNPMDAALSAIPTTKTVKDVVETKSTVEIIPSKVVGGWDAVPGGVTKTYHAKPDPSDWNMKDLQWYLKNLYSNKYAITLHIPIANGMKWLNDIKFAMSKKLDGKDPSHAVVKDYFDFCFAKHVDQIIRDEGSFSLYKLTKPKYIMDYFDTNRLSSTSSAPMMVPIVKPQAKPVEVSTESDSLTMTDLTTAYRINSQYMVTNYGVIIPMNYMMVVKGRTLEEAVAYVQGAMTKLAAKGPQEMGAVIAATNKYQPYPKWLRFTDVSKVVKMTIAISDDNPVFKDLTELK